MIGLRGCTHVNSSGEQRVVVLSDAEDDSRGVPGLAVLGSVSLNF